MTTRSMSDPWQEMRRLQREIEHLFAGATPAWRWPLGGEYPPVNITRGDTRITLEAMCPGADRATLDISVVGDALTIRGERKAEPGIGDEHYHRRERALGPFHRTIALGERLDGDRTVASYANGMLRVELARQPELTPKKILIQN